MAGTTINLHVAAIVAAVVAASAGWIVVGCVMAIMRRTVGLERPSLKWMDFWVGTAERLVAIALYIWKPEQLPWFIGAWVTAKFAANWKREKGEDAAQGSLMFLIGNVLSFSYALGAVYLWRRFLGTQ